MYYFSLNIPKAQYEAFVSQHPQASLLQSYDWTQVKSNWQAYHVGLLDQHHDLVAAGLVLVRKVKGLKFAYIPRGPIMDYHNQEVVQAFFDRLRRLGKKLGLIFIKMDPLIRLQSQEISDFNPDLSQKERDQWATMFRDLGLIDHGPSLEMGATFQPRFEALTKLEPDLIEKFPATSRKNIRKALNKGVEIRWSEGGIEDILLFEQIIKLTAEHKGIHLRDASYFKRLIDTYPNQFQLAFAQLDISKARGKLQEDLNQKQEHLERLQQQGATKQIPIQEKKIEAIHKSLEELPQAVGDKPIILAGVLAVDYGDRREMLYAGFDRAYQSFCGQYLLYSEMMEDAYEKGLAWANMGGVDGSLQGSLLRFKEHFRPQLVEYFGEVDLAINPLYGPLQKALPLLREWKKKLR